MSQRYFAEINSESIVLRVARAINKEWCESNLGGTWIETWKDGSQRMNFACAGYPYREDLDAFVPVREFKGWILNEENVQWEPPTPMPEAPEGDRYFWCDDCEDWKLESEVPEGEVPLQ